MNVNFNGYNENVATFMADSKLTTTGVPVKISADGTVAPCTSGEKFCGFCVGVRDGYAAVQLSGYVTVTTTSKLALGYTKLAGDGKGSIVANESGREYLVINSTATDAGIIL